MARTFPRSLLDEDLKSDAERNVFEAGDLDQQSRDNQIYVGMSRARNHCVIVAPKAA